ncbi:TPR protein [Trypanosoma grayi]|uniref:TPR protein n=1 Tax=Trypanosoma grayi TaxID=71804 RepID=UPI0004F46979|nr:TPR protein [Trypanosoma grayi]KEG14258.1 TPR protein [Trypanosoma grayi]
MSVVEELPLDSEGVSPPAVEVSSEAERAVDVVLCERLKKDGNELFTSGEVAEALKLYREALKVAPIKPVPKRKDAKRDTATGAAVETTTPTPATDGEKMGDESAEVQETDDDVDYTLTSQVYCNTGLCLSKLEMHEDAVDNLTEAIRHNRQYTKAYVRRAECYYVLGKWSNAYGDYEEYEKLGGTLDAAGRAHKVEAKAKVDEEMQKMLGDLKNLGNRFLNYFGLSTDNFKFDKDPGTGGYSMRFEK